MPPLSPALLRRVAARMDQASRVACCLGSKLLCDTLSHPGAWPDATVYALTPHALDHVCRLRVRSLALAAPDLAQAARFLEGMVERQASDPVLSLRVACAADAGPPCDADLLKPISRFCALQALAIECSGLSSPTCLAFPVGHEGLRDLRTLVVLDRSFPRKLEVYLADACLPALRDAVLEVLTSDVLARARSFRCLQKVVYVGLEETFEDADVSGMRLSKLRLAVPSRQALDFLMAALSHLSDVDELVLLCHEDARLDTYINARRVRLLLCSTCSEVSVVFPVVRSFSSLSVEGVVGGSPWTLRFEGAGSWHTFQKWTERADLAVGLDGALEIVP